MEAPIRRPLPVTRHTLADMNSAHLSYTYRLVSLQNLELLACTPFDVHSCGLQQGGRRMAKNLKMASQKAATSLASLVPNKVAIWNTASHLQRYHGRCERQSTSHGLSRGKMSQYSRLLVERRCNVHDRWKGMHSRMSFLCSWNPKESLLRWMSMSRNIWPMPLLQ